MKLLLALLIFASPGDTVLEMISNIRQSGSMSAIARYVYWEEAFLKINDKQKQEMQVSTSEELKTFFVDFIENPDAMMVRKIENSPHLSVSEREEKLEMLSQTTKLKKQMDQAQVQLLKDTEFSIGGETINENRAVVKLKSVKDGEEKTQDVPMVLIDGKWLLTSPNI